MVMAMRDKNSFETVLPAKGFKRNQLHNNQTLEIPGTHLVTMSRQLDRQVLQILKSIKHAIA
jgi:hypothetical protein